MLDISASGHRPALGLSGASPPTVDDLVALSGRNCKTTPFDPTLSLESARKNAFFRRQLGKVGPHHAEAAAVIIAFAEAQEGPYRYLVAAAKIKELLGFDTQTGGRQPTTLSDPIPGWEKIAEILIGLEWNEADRAANPFISPRERRASLAFLRGSVPHEDRVRLARMRCVLQDAPRTNFQLRDGQHATGRRVHSFSGGTRSSASSSDDGGGSDPLPHSVALAASGERPSHIARLEPPAYPASARRGELLPASHLVTSVLARLTGGAV